MRYHIGLIVLALSPLIAGSGWGNSGCTHDSTRYYSGDARWQDTFEVDPGITAERTAELEITGAQEEASYNVHLEWTANAVGGRPDAPSSTTLELIHTSSTVQTPFDGFPREPMVVSLDFVCEGNCTELLVGRFTFDAPTAAPVLTRLILTADVECKGCNEGFVVSITGP